MIHYKSAKWCFGIALSLSLSACNMMDTQPQKQVESRYEPMTQPKVVQQKPKPVQKTYATKDPTQQATPGPVHKAAPQLPVIQ